MCAVRLECVQLGVLFGRTEHIGLSAFFVRIFIDSRQSILESLV